MKSLICSLAVILGTAAPLAASSLDPLALYTFENGLTTDESGNGNNGTAFAGTSLATGASRDGSTALRLTPTNGLSGIDTGININRSAMSSMTMGGWVRATGPGFGVGGKFLSHDNGAFGRTVGLDVRGDSAGLDFGAFSGTGVEDANGSGSLINTWVHIAVVYDGANSGLFINGLLDTVFTDNTSTAPGLTAGLFIGTNSFFNEDFDGFLDDVFVFDRALNRGEVLQIATTGFDAPAPVPLPAGLPLLMAGLASFFFMRRKSA